MKKVAGYRVMLGMTQEKLAKYLNISRQSYSEKERGKVPFNDREKKLLKKLFLSVNPNVSIDELFF